MDRAQTNLTDAYLSASELADLVGCRPNQKLIMARWLTRHGWKWVPSKSGLPRVARAYHDRKLGITDGREVQEGRGLATEPNLGAFAGMGKHRGRPAV